MKNNKKIKTNINSFGLFLEILLIIIGLYLIYKNLYIITEITILGMIIIIIGIIAMRHNIKGGIENFDYTKDNKKEK